MLADIETGEKCECFTRAQFTRSVSHDGRDRVNHRRKLRRVFYAQTASTNLRFFLGKDNRRYSVRTYVGKEEEEGEEEKKEEEKEESSGRLVSHRLISTSVRLYYTHFCIYTHPD